MYNVIRQPLSGQKFIDTRQDSLHDLKVYKAAAHIWSLGTKFHFHFSKIIQTIEWAATIKAYHDHWITNV